jgi:hypothetical protein
VAQPRYADGAATRPIDGGGVQHGRVAAGGPRPWETARRKTDVTGTGAWGRGRLPASPVRVARTLRLLVDEWGWPVVPGAFADGGMCSCADPSCPEPGRHALADASWLAATSDAERVRDRWRTHPEAAIVLPVGWCFDLLEVPERGGREAIGQLEAQGHRVPPVIATATGRLLFLVSALDRHAGELAEAGCGAPAPRSAGTPRSAAPAGCTDSDLPDFAERGFAGRDLSDREEAARDAAAARAAMTEMEPWPASSTWLASAAGCRPETSIWVGGGVPDAPDVIVRRSGLLVAPLLGPEPPGVTRWLVPPAAVRRPLPRMEDVLGPIVFACRDAALRPVAGIGTRRPEEVPRRVESASRRPETVSGQGAEAVPVRGPERTARHAEGASRGNAVISGRESETRSARGPESGPSSTDVDAAARRPVAEGPWQSRPVRRLEVERWRSDAAPGGDPESAWPAGQSHPSGRLRPLGRSAVRPAVGLIDGLRPSGAEQWESPRAE